MNSIIYDDKIITPENNIYQYYYNFLDRLEQKDCVKVALFSAKTVNPNTKESNDCIELVEKWLKDEKVVNREVLNTASNAAYYASNAGPYAISAAFYSVANVADSVYYFSNAGPYAISYAANTAYAATNSVYDAICATDFSSNADKINQYLQILLRKTKQFQNNKILEQISKVDVDKLELVDWNMITDIMQEDYDIVHEFEYSDIFSRRCLIELLRKEYI